MKKKLRSGKGFSLVELLACLLILALLAVMVSSSVTAAVRVYQKSVYASESEALGSTVNTAMSDILRYAKYVGQNSRNELVFTNAAYGVNNSGHFLLDDKGYVCYVPYEGADETEQKKLINSGAYTSLYLEKLKVVFVRDAAGGDRGVFKITYTIRSHVLPDAKYEVSCSFRSLAGEF